MQTSLPTPPAALLVACLCAQWCGSCRDYQPLFAPLRAQFPHARFFWVDVEDEADLVDPIEVENFPTLLIARGEQALFFGPLTPHIETLQRLITALQDDDARPLPAGDAAHALAQRLGAKP